LPPSLMSLCTFSKHESIILIYLCQIWRFGHQKFLTGTPHFN
jgi:hypothetical protein